MKLVFLFVCSFLMFSCEKNEPVSGLTGTWNWVKSSGGFAGITIKASESSTKKLIFGQGNSYQFFENGKLVLSSTYRTEKGKSITSTELVDLIILKEVDGFKSSYTIINNRLYLFDEVYDGFQHEYVRA